MKTLRTISRVMLHSRAVDAIAEYIAENRLKPGDRLPSEKALAEQLGIGRNSLREAVRVLESNGAVSVRNGLGIFVGEANEGAGGISVRVNRQRVNLLELLDIRYALERYALDLCIRNATDDEIEGAEPHLLEMERLAGAGAGRDAMHAADAAYHRAVYSMGKNDALCDLLLQIDGVATSYWEPLEGHGELFFETAPAHRAQYQALLERNLKRALEATVRVMEIDAAFILKARPRGMDGGAHGPSTMAEALRKVQVRNRA